MELELDPRHSAIFNMLSGIPSDILTALKNTSSNQLC